MIPTRFKIAFKSLLCRGALAAVALPVSAAPQGEPGRGLQHDMFERPDLVAPVNAKSPMPDAAATPAPVPWRPSLRAVVLAGAQSMVLVDRSVVEMGSTLEGWRLIGVTAQEAVFSKGRQRVTLTLGRSGTGEP